MVKARGSAKTDTEIVENVLATAPNNYNLVTTLNSGKYLKDKETLKFAREQYRSYWKRHFEQQQNRRSTRGYSNVAAAYTIKTKDKHKVNAIGNGQRGHLQGNKAPGKPWKKFKGFCKNCGIHGHKAVNCTKDKGNLEKQVQKETRKCYICNKVGHLAREKSTDTAFVGCILTKKVAAINDKDRIENNEFDPITKLNWIDPIELANQIDLEEGSKKVYFDQEIKMDENSNLARGPKTKKIYKVNMINSHLEIDEYQSEEEFDNDNYSTDSGDSQNGDPDLEYRVTRETPKPRVVKRDFHYREINKRYDFKCYGCKSTMEFHLVNNESRFRCPWCNDWEESTPPPIATCLRCNNFA
jgi:Zinc knuckle